MSILLGVIYATLAAITWGINSHILHRGAQAEHPMMALVYRALVSFPILLVLTLILRSSTALLVYLDLFNLGMTGLLVLMIILGDAIFIYSMKKYPVSVILPIATSYPVFTSLILIFSGLESFGPLVIVGTFIVVLGIYLVTRYRYNEERERLAIDYGAVLLGLGVALGWGMSVIFARIVLDQEGTESFGLMTVRTLLIGSIALVLYFGSADNRTEFSVKSTEKKLSSLQIFGISGIFGWVLGATFLFLALEEIQAAIATPISAANPVIAVIIGQITGIDRINSKQLLGILCTTLGVILVIL